MSQPFDPARLGIALDEAEVNGLHPEFTALLKAMVGKADLLDRLVRNIECDMEDDLARGEFEHRRNRDLLAFIAEHRGETPEATLARLSPPPPSTGWTGDFPRAAPGTITMSGVRVINGLDDLVIRTNDGSDPNQLRRAGPSASLQGSISFTGFAYDNRPARAVPDTIDLSAESHADRMARLIRENRIGPR